MSGLGYGDSGQRGDEVIGKTSTMVRGKRRSFG